MNTLINHTAKCSGSYEVKLFSGCIILAFIFTLWFTSQLLSQRLLYLLWQDFKWNIAVSLNSQMRKQSHGMVNKDSHGHIVKCPMEWVQKPLPPSLGDRQEPSKDKEKAPKGSYTIATFTENLHKDIIRDSGLPCCPRVKNMSVNTS